MFQMGTPEADVMPNAHETAVQMILSARCLHCSEQMAVNGPAGPA
jgi:hypothetical protein